MGSQPEGVEGNGHGSVPSDDGARLVVAPDGRYLDADTAALDLFGVTLDVLRTRRFGDFAPPDFLEDARRGWVEWIASGDTDAEGEGTLVHPDGTMVRVGYTLHRQADGTSLLVGRAIDAQPLQPHVVRVQAVLTRWRELERQLSVVGEDDPDRPDLVNRIDALRVEYQRRTNTAG